MREILTTIALGVTLMGHAQSVIAQGESLSITAEHITAVDAEAKAAAREITLTGTLRRAHREPGRWVGLNDDFRQLRDLCFRVERLDLSQAQIDTIPDCAFHSMHQLREVILPPTLRHIGSQAFYACDALEKVEFRGERPMMDAYAFGATRFADWSAPEQGSVPYESAFPILPVPRELTLIGGTFTTGAKVTTRINPSLPAEGYHIRAKGKKVLIEGGDEAGIFYGRMTLEQIYSYAESKTADLTNCLHGNGPDFTLPAVDIVDAPRTPIRELMIDPARIFIPFDDLKGFVVEMARYKLNTLHLHLVDDQAWRIEIKAYPELTERSSFRVGMDDMLRPIGGYYTQEQMRELCQFAAQHHVTIVPEIELPGHEVAAIHALPWLTCQQDTLPLRTTCGVSNELLCPSSERTYEFLSTVLRELADVFPGPYVHLGGDEAGNPPLNCWKDCPSCQELLKKLVEDSALSEASQPSPQSGGDGGGLWRLQQYMFDRVIALLRDELGKTPMFWYETDFREIQPGCITFAWRHGLTQAAIDAAKRCDAKIILCPGEHCYLDYPMGYNDMPEVNWGMPTTTLEQTYRLDPAWGNGDYTIADPEHPGQTLDRNFERDCLMGVAGTLWTECIPSTERLYYMAYPRALALAEAGWSQQSRRSWDDFQRRAAIISRAQLRRGVCVDQNF
ncbi:MAG: family 20 glycosylhydrolase [Bacteroidales bacterium]|nr:family 20 glycosylhydrolase [Bacteroidales bacterium]